MTALHGLPLFLLTPNGKFILTVSLISFLAIDIPNECSHSYAFKYVLQVQLHLLMLESLSFKIGLITINFLLYFSLSSQLLNVLELLLLIILIATSSLHFSSDFDNMNCLFIFVGRILITFVDLARVTASLITSGVYLGMNAN